MSGLVTVKDLLSMSRKEFLVEAYQFYLNRKPDQIGYEYYLNQLDKGKSKIAVLDNLRRSSEGKRLRSNLRGFKREMLKHRLANLPVISWFYQGRSVQLNQIQNKIEYIVEGLNGGSIAAPSELNSDHLIHVKDQEILALQNKVQNTDLTWAQFEKQVLFHRKKYKGIFVQELAIDWNVPLYQRPQHISSAFGRLGYLVIYKTANWGNVDNINGVRQVDKNVWITDLWDVCEIEGAIHSVYSTAHLYTPENIVARAKGKILYEYIDHIDPQISGDENVGKLLDLKEWAFSGGADYIVTSAQKLYDEACSVVNKEKVILAKNGVDTRHYREFDYESILPSSQMLEFRNKFDKIVGYFGALAPWLWYDVIDKLVKLRPDLGFVFIGPDYYGGADKLPEAENVIQLGSIDYKVLPAYANLFDVCFIPFAPGEIAKTTSPLKLFEYFALEKPVVVTSDMRECVVYPQVFSGSDVASLSNALNEAFNVKDDPDFRFALRELADANDWDERVLTIEKAIL